MDAFESLVALCRIASKPHIAGTDLVLSFQRSTTTVGLLPVIEAGGWDTTLRVNGQTTSRPLERLLDGAEVELVVHGMVKSNDVVTNNIGMLLRYNLGAFLGRPPKRYFLIQEDYASWEPPRHADVLAYLRTLRLVHLLQRLADVVKDRVETAGEAIFLTSRKLSIPLIYDASVLHRVASDADIDMFESTVFNDHHGPARLDIAKRALSRFFATVNEQERFAELLGRLPQLNQSILADFDLYASGFNFDKAREDFERRKLDFVVKTNSAGSDAMNKLIAIPIGQGLLASQMKAGAEFAFLNQTLLVASLVFAVIAAMLLTSLVLTLRQISGELRTEKRLLQDRALPTFQQLKPMISELEGRIQLHVWGIPVVLGALLVATTSMTIAAFLQMTT